MTNLLKEPLLHFLLAGGALFLLFGEMGNSQAGDYTIVIDDSDIDLLINRWEMQWKRFPTEDELQSLFDNFLQEEVYYREALNMNLDHNDEIIRRRMAQKMEFLTKDLAEMTVPDDEALLKYYLDHIDSYTLSPKVTLAQAYFSHDVRDEPTSDAKKLLETLKDREPAPDLFEEIGDRISLQTYFEASDRADLIRKMGNQFAEVVMQQKTPGWLEDPVVSGYGMHLVYVYDIVPERTREFEEVRERVLQDFRYDLSREYNTSMFNSLVNKYDVILDFKEYRSLQNKLTLENELGDYR